MNVKHELPQYMTPFIGTIKGVSTFYQTSKLYT